MNQTDRKNRPDQLNTLNRIIDRLREHYSMQTVGKRECFRTAKGVYFKPFALFTWNALAIEYAENKTEAEEGRFEDGDLFYLDEMAEDEIFSAMLKEIEN